MAFSPEVWNRLLHRLEDQLPAFSIEMWLRPLLAQPEGDGVRLGCPSAFHLGRVRDRFLPHIREGLRAELGREVAVHLERSSEAQARPSAERPVPRPDPPVAGQLSPSHSLATSAPRPSARSARGRRFSFESFVVGPSNALAREAAVAIAGDTHLDLRQLFLVSSTGLGKTHLARAVLGAAQRSGARRPVYRSAEAFTNDFLAAIRNKETALFKRRFRRDCDLLIIEDIHFLEGKKATQLEFFHTLRHLLDSGGRVVLTADRFPQTLTGLDESLRSQLGAGLVAQIDSPDARVRRDILRSKTAAGGVKLPDPCLELLVDEVRGSVRDLESVLIQLVTTAALLKKPIDLELTREALTKKYARPPGASQRPDPALVIRVVSSYFKTTGEALASRSRAKRVLVPRQLAMYLCHRYTDASQSEIGRAFGREHPAVKNAIARVERQVLESAPLRYQLESLSARLDQLIFTGQSAKGGEAGEN